MRAPFQILAIPYKYADGELLFCVFLRADLEMWQFISGGGEDDETPIEAAKREVFEESGITAKNILRLKSTCCIPAEIFPKMYLDNWPADTYVVPEYSFGFECNEDITLSHEHSCCKWFTYDEACKTLKWDSNRTALYELKRRLEVMQNQK